MKILKTSFVLKRVITLEIIGFALIILFIWIDEIADIPYLILGSESTPINWTESIFESVIISSLGAATILITLRLLQRIKNLEEVLPICDYCKRIKDENNTWSQIEEYVRCRSDSEFSHGICPDCAIKLNRICPQSAKELTSKIFEDKEEKNRNT